MKTHTQAKHTAGPWQLAARETESSFEGFTFKRRAIYGTQSMVCIADVCGPEIRTESPTAHDEFVANAQLIASAPELLAALIACERQLDAETLGGAALDAARAAIARATCANS